ncbi:MAG: TetR/AcrR family transcriptional regulator [Nocardioidaceae bacterium]
MTTKRELAGRANTGRRDELVDAAIRVVAREGLASTTTRKIADESGLPLGTVHYWFTGKEQLLEEVLLVTMRRMSDAVEATARSNAASLLDTLRAAWRTVTEEPDAQLALYELTCMAVRTPGMRTLAERQYALYRTVAHGTLERWAEHVDLPLSQLGPLSTLLASSFDGLVLAWLADPEGTDADQALQMLVALIESLTFERQA